MARGRTKAVVDAGPVEGPWELPEGWRWEQLDTIAAVIAGQSPPSSTYNDSGTGLPFYQGKAEFGVESPSVRKWCSAPTKLAQRGDVLISVRAPVGPTNIATEQCGIGRGLAAIRPKLGKTSARWLRYWLRRTEEVLASQGTGTTFAAITGDVLRAHPCPVPPPEVQSRIVARIDALFAEIDEGEAALAEARAGVDTYRKALLKAAVTGELTADWRRDNPPQETGEQLLQRILTDRRASWQADPKNARKKYVEPAGPDTDDLPELPEGWIWAAPQQLLNWSSGKFLPDKAMVAGSYPVYGGNGINGNHHAANVDRPTLVIGRVGHYCGNAYATDGPAWVTDNAIFADGIAPGISVLFLRHVFTSAKLRARAQGGAQPFVSQTMLNEVAVPLPPPAEQFEIERHHTKALESLEGIVSAFETEAPSTLRQSILAAAFRGELAA